MIFENIKEVKSKINAACERANRSSSDVTLIAVSKTKPTSDIKAVLEAGIIEFGENKVQEMCAKYDELPKQIHWHFIGHLQRNKVKYIVGKTKLLHSVDTIRLAEQIDIESKKCDVITDVLVQVNIAKEDTKYGLLEEDVEGFVRQVAALPHIKIRGLMTVAPFTQNPEDNRQYFIKMHKLYVDINSKNIDNVNMSVLSMGMTGDYEVAVEEGATMVRVGTGIFGERIYN